MLQIIIMILVFYVMFKPRNKSGSRSNTRKKQSSMGDMVETLKKEFDFGAGADELRRWMNEDKKDDSPYDEYDDDFEDEEEYEVEGNANQPGSIGGYQPVYDDTQGSMGNYQPMQPQPHNVGHHMYADEVNEYEFKIEHAYTEQGMGGDVAAQGCDTMADVRLVKRSKPKKDSFVVEQEQLLQSLNDLPSAIVAAEILGKPKALQGRR